MAVKAVRRSGGKSPAPDASPLIPARPTIKGLREAAAGCQACPLWKLGTRTVFGEGPRHPAVVMVGEQPGDKEDLAGHPFVGPAGMLLDRALAEAGLDRAAIYLTNAVKHFKWKPRGKRRIHEKPAAGEIHACRPWLTAELAVLKPRILVCLGATAAQSILGKSFKVTQQRGQFLSPGIGPEVLATVHPSALLRAPDEETRHAEIARFIDDLRKVADRLAELKAAA